MRPGGETHSLESGIVAQALGEGDEIGHGTKV
jgi:hypothetical protein